MFGCCAPLVRVTFSDIQLNLSFGESAIGQKFVAPRRSSSFQGLSSSNLDVSHLADADADCQLRNSNNDRKSIRKE